MSDFPSGSILLASSLHTFPSDSLGEDFDWEKETKNPKIAKKLVLSTKEKLDLLLKYLDIVRIPLPKTAKNGTLNKKANNAANGANKQASEMEGMSFCPRSVIL